MNTVSSSDQVSLGTIGHLQAHWWPNSGSVCTRERHFKDQNTILSYLHNGISFTGKMTLYGNSAQQGIWTYPLECRPRAHMGPNSAMTVFAYVQATVSTISRHRVDFAKLRRYFRTIRLLSTSYSRHCYIQSDMWSLRSVILYICPHSQGFYTDVIIHVLALLSRCCHIKYTSTAYICKYSPHVNP